ncbi:MAG TPA: hypothetical protein DEG47_21625, partial [Cyanobacteria bacterium UBA11148]|nr:hypothetical protein [Cyanobacteria bacterium UBA11148]
MKRIKQDKLAFRVRLVGAIAGSVSMVVYPAVVKAESSINAPLSTPEQNLSISNLQVDRLKVEDSGELDNRSQQDNLQSEQKVYLASSSDSRRGINSTANSSSPLKWTE